MTEIRCDDCNDILPLTPDEIAEIREDYPCAILCDECRSRRRDCCAESARGIAAASNPFSRHRDREVRHECANDRHGT